MKTHFSDLQTAWVAKESDLKQVEGLGQSLVTVIRETRQNLNPEEFLEIHQQKNPQFWTPSDRLYPRLLLEIPSPPPVLYYLGQVQAEENQGLVPMVSIVGTRQPTAHGLGWTRRISTALAQAGFTVVSGMAAGIDGEAHQSALKAKGRTWAIVGTGVERVYPAQHRNLHQSIQTQGLIVSEYPAESAPERGNFPARNRIIAGLSRAIIVMEAPEKSGSLITSRYAQEFNRDIYILPNSPDVEAARGCLKLLHQGAEVILSVEELLEQLGAIPRLEPETAAIIPELSPDLAKVYHLFKTEPLSFDLIVAQSALSAGDVSGILLQLELEGLITQLPGMRYQKAL
jgi:DNA processing protein